MRETSPCSSRTRSRSLSASLASWENLDGRHHALVLMRQNMAVVNEAADDQRISERDDDLHLASDRHVDDVAVVVGWLRDAIDLSELERPLVNVEGVELVRIIADRPLLYSAELDAGVSPVHVELLAVYEHRITVRRLREHDRAPVGDLPAEVFDREQRRGQGDRRRR